MIRFTKMQGACNDFVVINNTEENISAERLPELAIELCRRRVSVGADGVLIIQEPSKLTESGNLQKPADVKMTIYNADGSRSEMCGNGARCVAKYCFDRGICSCAGYVTIESDAGPVNAWKAGTGIFRLEMNPTSRVERDVCLTVDGKKIVCTYVELGNPGLPHLVTEYNLKTACESSLWTLGNRLRNHPELEKGANVNFIHKLDEDSIQIKTYERGVEDFTYACGTGACAAVAALMYKGESSGRSVRVRSAGGLLVVDGEFEENDRIRLFLTGEAVTVYEGVISWNM